MLSRRSKLSALAVLAAVGASGYFLYSAYSTQGVGELAQAPMNIEAQIPPAFIMALDDSGSMIWEVLNNTRDGVFSWSTSKNSFYNGSVPYGYDNGNRFYYQFPYPGRGDSGAGIPPLDSFGFARSPVSNPAYFDPAQTYSPWKNYDGSDYVTIDPANAPFDPRPNGSSYRINLTETATGTDNSGWSFLFLKGMQIPAGASVSGSCSASPSLPSADRSGWRTLTSTSAVTSTSCSLFVKYYPATFYLQSKSAVPADYGYKDSAVVEVPASSQGIPVKLYRYEIKAGNFDTTAHYTAAIQNFANWFSMYRTRREALIGSLTNALLDVNQSMRVGWFTINSMKDVTMYDVTDETERKSLYQNFYSLTANGVTPTRQAVNYIGKQFQRSSGSSLPIEYSCQKNAGMLFTDGYINDGNNPSTAGNADGNMGSPFADSYSNTMADIAAYYYNLNLRGSRTDLVDGKVPVPSQCDTLYDASKSIAAQSTDWKRLDCNTNLHMNFYGITLGSSGAIYGVNADSTDDPYAYPPTWAARKDLAPEAVDEMWHATINARGEMVNAKSPAAIAEAMRQILASVGGGATPAGTIALTGSRIGSGSLTVVPFYESKSNGTDWYGKLTAQKVARDSTTLATIYTDQWEASAKLPAATDRNIYFGASGGASLFNSSSVALADLCGDILSRCSASEITTELKVTLDQAIAYLRGDQTLEASKDTPLRTRTTRLGDIVNSTPVISAPTDDYGYKSIYDRTTGEYDPYGYAAFLKNKAKNRANMVYVGANDGMLHAFDGTTGVEKFAYVPQSVLGHMGNLLFPYKAEDKDDQVFQHRYYVDGPITVSDVADGKNDWTTVLVGTAGAGGKGAFALDVSDPGSFAGASRLWELNGKSSDASIANNIGNVLGKPVIVPVRSTTGSVSWKAIFGNGYGSTNGKAVLFVVDVRSGKVTLIPAQESGVAGSNGLGNIVVLDRWSGDDLTTATRDGYADTVYAADQKGAIWKFDLRSVAADPAATTILDAVTTPLFVATDDEGNRQPILGGLQAAAGPGGGVMVYFGTGAFSFKSDAIDNSQQTLYGVLDRGASTTLGRANLLEQEIIATVSGARTTTRYSMSAGKLGWYIDLASTGERFVGNPEIENGIVFFPTFDPSSTDACSTVGANWLYGLNALNGAAALSGVTIGSLTGDSYAVGTGAVALSTTGSAPVKDVAVMTTARGAPLASGATNSDLDNALLNQCSMVIQASGASPLYMPRACGRQSWRQIK